MSVFRVKALEKRVYRGVLCGRALHGLVDIGFLDRFLVVIVFFFVDIVGVILM